MTADGVLITVQMRFPSIDRRVLGEHLTPMIVAAISVGGEFTSVSVQPHSSEDEDEDEDDGA